ncbi:helix-turn-helix transcriptional regulator [Streptomyces tendae]|uniref:helix-turn-helix transcriptional regulator n=1 Tax=Streptomyces tendae TaxID=1932 RepID=UPI0036B2D7B6
MNAQEDFITPAEFAAIARVRPGTPAQWRHRGVGPEWFKLGSGRTSRVLYRRSDVLAWLEAHKVPA